MRINTKQKKMKEGQMVKVPHLGWVTKKVAMQIAALELLDRESTDHKDYKLIKCTLDGKTIKVDARWKKAVYVLYNNGEPNYAGSTAPGDGDITRRPLDHAKPGKYQKEFDSYHLLTLPDDVDHLMAEMHMIERCRRQYHLKNDYNSPPVPYKIYYHTKKLYQSYKKRKNVHTEPFGVNHLITNYITK
jgi:hypothetical protein